MANKDIKGLTDQELSDKIRDEKSAIEKLKLNHGISPIENPLSIRSNRKNIARMLTEQNNRKNKSSK